jgi:flagellar assembly protein FliH
MIHRARVLSNLCVGAVPRRLIRPPQAPPRTHQEGYEQGLREGREAARIEAWEQQQTVPREWDARKEQLEMQWNARGERLDLLAKGLKEARQAFQAGAEGLLVRLAYEALLRVLSEQDVSRSLVSHRVSELLREMPPLGGVIRVSIKDHARLGQELDLDSLAAKADVQIQADPALKVGDCLVDTPNGLIDVGIGVQLHALADAWLAALSPIATLDPSSQGQV